MDLATISPLVKVLLKDRQLTKAELEKKTTLNLGWSNSNKSSYEDIYKFLLEKGILREEGDVVTLNVSSTYKS